MFTPTLVTPEKKLVAGQEIEELFIPGYRGELNVLPGHAPLLTTLGTGVLKYRVKGESQFHLVAVSDGYCQVNPNGVNVLAETAERPEELDVQRAEAAEKDAEKNLNSQTLDPEGIADMQAKLARARTRREVAAGKGASGQTTH